MKKRQAKKICRQFLLTTGGLNWKAETVRKAIKKHGRSVHAVVTDMLKIPRYKKYLNYPR